MKTPVCYLDFEFTDTHKEKLNVICCCLTVDKTKRRFWFHDGPKVVEEFKTLVDELNEKGYVFCAYQVVAEARSFYSLGLDPTQYKWICLHIEDKMCTNSNNKWGYGNQLIKGREVYTKNDSKWNKTEEELKKLNMSKPERSYSAACFRYLDVKIDSKEKNECRDLILRKKRGFTKEEKLRILDYCESDVVYLAPMLEVILRYYYWFFSKALPPHEYMKPLLRQHILNRGRYAAFTSIMESVGYPVHPKWFKKFIVNSPDILIKCRKDLADQFEQYTPFRAKVKKKPDDLSMDTKAVKSWIEEKSGHAKNWLRTDKGQYSLSKDAWSKFYNFKHDYPRKNYAAQMMRYLKLKESLNGFMPYSKNPITNNYDPIDSRIRPYFNIYGSQTARTQPAASSFIPLKAAWSRALIHPKDDKTFLCGIDYSSQEVLIQAVLSNDEALFGSYTSGDVYLDFAKRAKAVPEDGTRDEYELERDLFKSTFLGISYGMKENSLALKLSNDLGKEVSVKEAKNLINMYDNVYKDYGKYLADLDIRYRTDKFLALPCGWVLFGDNINVRSIRNFMIQGSGSSIMRRAVELCYINKLKVVYTLHDAIYCELSTEKEVVLFEKLMKYAFTDVLKHEWSKSIRVDVSCYGSYFKTNEFSDKSYETKEIYIDSRSKKDFDFFSPYFIN